MIKALLLRRFWLIRHRFMTTLAFMIILPLMLHVSITMVMENILVHSLSNIPYDVWVFPGIILLIAVSSTFAMIYRDLFDLRIHKKSFIPITMAPYSKFHLVVGFLTTSIIESLIYVIFAMGILTLLLSSSLPWSAYIIIPIFSFLYTFLFGNLMITFSVLTDRISTYLFISVIMFLFIIFGTGVLVEFDFYPKTIGTILSYNPLSIVLTQLRQLLFSNTIQGDLLAIPVVTSLIWTWMNGALLKRRLKQ